MQFDVWSKGLATLEADCLVVGIHDNGADDSPLTEEAKALDAATGGRIAKLVSRGDFPGRTGETLLIPDLEGLKATRVLLTGLGSQKNFSRKAFRKALAAAVTALNRTRIASVAFAVARPSFNDLDDYYFGRVVAEVVGTTLYKINDLKSGKKPKPPTLETVIAGPVRGAGASAAKRGLTHGAAIAAASKVQRDLANLPGNVCTPSYLADQAKALAKGNPSVKVTVLDEAAIKKEKMGCFLAVTQGSAEPPRFIVMEYKGPKAPKAPIVLVGKGITFDTGGISLKDPGAMDEMKFDMSGSAAVIAALTLVSTLKLPLNVVGLIAAAENMPSATAIKPGDIVTSAAGHTVEILNTDAEGRLVLCDALHYARRYEPAAIVDLATLTGACVVALGAHHAGCMANDDALAREIVAAGVRADDRAWHLPVTEEYADQLKSNFADFANIGGREGGAITAAAFLGKFVQGLKWAHLDIAGVAYQGGANKGSTGRPTALLADFLIHRAGR
jgi:leucyl aminopeptidase